MIALNKLSVNKIPFHLNIFSKQGCWCHCPVLQILNEFSYGVEHSEVKIIVSLGFHIKGVISLSPELGEK